MGKHGESLTATHQTAPAGRVNLLRADCAGLAFAFFFADDGESGLRLPFWGSRFCRTASHRFLCASAICFRS